MEKQLYLFNFPNLTKKQYDQVWDEVRKAGHSNPAGLLHHVSAFQNNQCFVVDIWESSEAFDSYSKILKPIFERVGVRLVNPIISPVHYEYSGVEAHITH